MTAWLPADAEPTRFDPEVLRSRGIDPSIAAHFSTASRFLPGRNLVELSVNGSAVGRYPAHFDAEGRICLSDALLRLAGLRPVPSSGKTANPASPPRADRLAQPVALDCRAFLDAFPTTAVHLLPEQQAVELVTPPEAVAARAAPSPVYTTGGAAAILNYNVLAGYSRSMGGASRFLQGSVESGFNYQGWVVRSQDAFSMRDGSRQWSHVQAYGQRSFTGYRTALQIGQLMAQGDITGGAPITGVQIAPEQALLPRGSGSPMIQGIAHSQARVEVRQGGILIHSTVVPPGPFSFSELPLLSTRRDVTVEVIEADGRRHGFSIPAAAVQQLNIGPPAGFSMSLGKLRNLGGAAGPAPWLASVAHGFALGSRVNLSHGVTLASGYRALGIRLDAQPAGWLGTSAQLVGADNPRRHARGVKATLLGSARLAAGFSMDVSETRQSRGYSDLLDVPRPALPSSPGHAIAPGLDRDRPEVRRTIGLSWSGAALGNFNLSYDGTRFFHGLTSRRLFVSWGKRLGLVNLSISAERALGARRGGHDGDNLYVSASFALGRHDTAIYGTRSGTRRGVGVRTGAALGEHASYSLSAERDNPGTAPSASANLNLTPRHVQLALGSAVAAGSRSWSVQASGAAVWHADGLSFSPYPVRDTFGIATVGRVAGIALHTPAGKVWTDAWGRAVIPSLPAYGGAQVEVMVASLKRNMDLANGYRRIHAARGAVGKLQFAISKVRRALLNVTAEDGGGIPQGSAIVDTQGRLVTLAGAGNMVFLPDLTEQALFARHPDGASCRLEFAIPRQAPADSVYERIDAVCRTVPPARSHTP